MFMAILLNTKDAEEEYPLARMLQGTGQPIGIVFGVKVYCSDEVCEGEALFVDL